MGHNRVSGLDSKKFTDLKARTNGNTIERPLPVGSRAWHGPANPFPRSYETFLPRKLVSWTKLKKLCGPLFVTIDVKINHQSPSVWCCPGPLFITVLACVMNKKCSGSCSASARPLGMQACPMWLCLMLYRLYFIVLYGLALLCFRLMLLLLHVADWC
jgi:hypothetical protein